MEEGTSAARVDLSRFVDDQGRPICLKYNGFYPHNFKKVPHGTCRWRSECRLSHAPPTAQSREQLECLSSIYVTKESKRLNEQKEVANNSLQKPLPTWLHECRRKLCFSVNGESYENLRNTVIQLLATSWTETKLGGTCTLITDVHSIQHNQNTSYPLELLHQHPSPLPADNIPICPSLVHGYRLNGRKFPKSWTAAYKMTQKMVQKMHKTTVYEEYIRAYKAFIRDNICPLFAANTKSIYYQCPPTLRVHMPGRCATIGVHRDADFDGHEPSEVNFWIPLTEVFDTNTLWCESDPDSGDFSPFEMSPGQGMRFNGYNCRHFTKPNSTDFTRVSFDFRVIPGNLAVRPKEFMGKIGDYPTEEMTCESI